MIYEENGKIIVDELRPMSEAPFSDYRDNYILAKRLNVRYLLMLRLYLSNGERVFIGDLGIVPEILLEGFIPMPEYRRKE